MPKTVITMPAYRAVKTLERTVAAIPAGVADELILVDDASADGTVELARSLGLRVHVHAVNLGYGGNQKTCYVQALREGADIVVLLHPDYQYDPKAVPLLIAPILAGDADMTFGSRFAGLGNPLEGGMPLYRYLGNRLTTTLENLMLGSRFTETHSGMRAYARECLLSLPFVGYSNDFAFDSQFLVDAVTSGLRVVEVPIPTRYTKESSSIAVLASLRYVAGSLAYCARKVAERGRRGRRNPIVRWRGGRRPAWPPQRPGIEGVGDPAPANEPDPHEPDGSAVWTVLPPAARGYAVRGTRVVKMTSDESPRAGDAADIVLVDRRAGEPSHEATVLEDARALVDDEGLLVLSAPVTDGVRPHEVFAGLATSLTAAGFRPVGWSSPRRGAPSDVAHAVVVARPVLSRPLGRDPAW